MDTNQTQSRTATEFETFARRRGALLKVLDRGGSLLRGIGLDNVAQNLSNLSSQLQGDTFKVLVMGEFKRGKSTFINALLGEEVLPSDPIPCTAIINVIKYADEKRAVLHFGPYDDAKVRLMPEVARLHAERHKGGEIPPLEIDKDSIEDYVVIEDPGKDQRESVAESPYSHVELFWPLKYCRNGVEIIDSPGLNENKTRTSVTTNYAPYSDAVIFILSSHAVASASEESTIDDLRANGHESMFFVVNRFDEIRPRDREKVKAFAVQKLSGLTSLGAKGLHFISSLDALEAKTDNFGRPLPEGEVDNERLISSGFAELEEHLEEYLVRERGRIKLIRPLRIARKHLMDAIGKSIPMQISMYGMEVEEIQRRYDAALPNLEEARARKAKVMLGITRGLSDLKDFLRQQIEIFIKDMSFELPNMIQGYEPEAKIKIFKITSLKSQCEDLAKELMGVIERKMAEMQRKWSAETLAPEFERRVKNLFESAELDIGEFLKKVDEIRLSFGQGITENDQKDVSGVERVLAAGAAFFLISPGAMFQANMYGFSGLLKALLPQVGVAIALGFLGVINPLVWIGALFGTGFLQALVGASKAEDKVKDELCRKAGQEMRANASATAKAAVDKVAVQLKTVEQEFEKGLDAEICNVERNVDEVLQQRKMAKDREKERVAYLNAVLADCANLAKSLEDIESELDQNHVH